MRYIYLFFTFGITITSYFFAPLSPGLNCYDGAAIIVGDTAFVYLEKLFFLANPHRFQKNR